ncbi:hypothetical protein [Streptomyces sp. PR69]|nr:hypothetical protein [Streptomyces sp. PR69]
MPSPLPRDPTEQQVFGVPSPELAARAASGFDEFLSPVEDDEQDGKVSAS